MPYPGKGARLYFQRARRDRNGRLIERGVWCIRDGRSKKRTGFGESTGHGATAIASPKLQDALAAHIRAKRKVPRDRDRHPSEIMIADVISIYTEDVAPKQARPKEVAARLGKLLDFFGIKRLSELNAKLCGKYVEWRGHEPAARRELEDLRAAVRH